MWAHTSANLTPEESVEEKERPADGQADRQTDKVKRVELGLDFKVLGRYDCSSHLRSGWGESETSGGRPIIICPTCCCDLVIFFLFVRKPCLESSRGEFWEGRGEERGVKELKRKKNRGGRQEHKEGGSQEKGDGWVETSVRDQCQMVEVLPW